jgi:CRP/FNR family transcriptional regulator
MKTDFLTECYPNLENELLHEIEKHAIIKAFDTDEYIVKQGQYIKFLPIIRKGCVKVFCSEDAIDFLLYFIQSGESCIYSFAHISSGKKAEFSAIAELDSELLLLPIDKVIVWIKRFPSLNAIILTNYGKHYDELLNTTKQVIYYDLEDRLLKYLRTKAKLQEAELLSLSHQNIAQDLGSSREVVSRIMKKLSIKGKVQQVGHKIKVL